MILSNYLLINFFEIAAFQKNISNGKTCMISVRFASLKNEMHYFLRKSHTLWGILHAHYIFLTMWTGLSSKKGLYFQIIVHRVSKSQFQEMNLEGFRKLSGQWESGEAMAATLQLKITREERGRQRESSEHLLNILVSLNK